MSHLRPSLLAATLACAGLAACASAPKPRELEAFETIKSQQSLYQAALKRAPQLVADAERLLQRSQDEWRSKDLEESRRDALMGQTKLKTSYALVEQDQAKARIDAANAQFGKTEEEGARMAKELAQVSEQVNLLRKLGDTKQAAAAEHEKLTRKMAEEQDRNTAQQKLAAAELALRNAEAVNAGVYAAVEYGAAKDLVERARMELKQSNWSGAGTSAELAKSKADQALTTAKPQFDQNESGRDQKARNEELSRDAAGLPGTSVRLERKGQVQRLVLPYGKLFAKKMTTVTPGNDAALACVAGLLKKYGSYPVQIVGHTDNRGKKDGLLALSQARAQAVYNELVSRGVEAKRMSVSGMGPDEPASDNKTTAGRAANNRVEIVLILQ